MNGPRTESLPAAWVDALTTCRAHCFTIEDGEGDQRTLVEGWLP
jgi:hypothetical protein